MTLLDMLQTPGRGTAVDSTFASQVADTGTSASRQGASWLPGNVLTGELRTYPESS